MMNHVSVNTSQNISIDYDVAGLGERILAYLIDISLFVIVFLFFLLLVGSTQILLANSGYVVVVILYGLLYVFYDLICEVFFNGQSIGKRVMKIKVISLDGYQPSLGQYLLRWVFRLVDFTLSGQVGGLIAIAVTPNKQRIGDLVAGTTVIKTVPRATLQAVAFKPPVEKDHEEVLFPQVLQLNDRDMGLIQEVITHFHQSGNHMLIYKTAMKVKEVLQASIPPSMDEMQFLEQVIKDYMQLSAREA